MTQEGIVVREDRHLILALAEILDRVGSSRVVFKVWHHELLREAARGDLGERRVEDVQPVGFCLLME